MKVAALGLAGLAIIGTEAGPRKRLYKKHRWCTNVWWNLSQLNANFAEHPGVYNGDEAHWKYVQGYQRQRRECCNEKTLEKCRGYGFFQDGSNDYVLGAAGADSDVITEQGSLNDMILGHGGKYKGAKKRKHKKFSENERGRPEAYKTWLTDNQA